MPITFKVSEVEEETIPLPKALVSEVLAQQRITEVEAASKPARPYVECLGANGLLMAVHLAYQHHYPLTLSPDHIWLCIAQGLARHINENAEALRSRFVRHQGKIPLEVRRDEFIKGSSKNDWQGVFAEFSTQLKEHMGNRRDLFINNFSTTDATARAVSEVVLLGAVKKYFEYTLMSSCGIPEITLEGTPKDWANICQRVEVLEEFDLAWWVKELRPVVAQFEAASRGQIDLLFWKEFYKYLDASGGDRVSGHINALFPYEKDKGKQRNPWFQMKDSKQKYLYPASLKFDDFSGGLTSAPFTWKYLRETLPMSFVGGFFGVVQEENRALRPQIAWAVTKEMRGAIKVTDPWRLDEQKPQQNLVQKAGTAIKKAFVAVQGSSHPRQEKISEATKEVEARKEECQLIHTEIRRANGSSIPSLKKKEREKLLLLREAQDKLYQLREELET